MNILTKDTPTQIFTEIIDHRFLVLSFDHNGVVIINNHELNMGEMLYAMEILRYKIATGTLK